MVIRNVGLPMTGMEIIDYNDPILRRTRERALARANNVRVANDYNIAVAEVKDQANIEQYRIWRLCSLGFPSVLMS